MAQYCTKDDIENYLLITIDSSFSSQVGLWIDQIQKYIDEETGRNFSADTTASVRLYELDKVELDTLGRQSKVPTSLHIDDAVEITSVVVQDTDGDNSKEISYNQLFFYPANKTPKTRIEVADDATTKFRVGLQNIKVTAKWGYSTTPPDDIRFAATVLTAGILQFARRHQGELSSVTIGRYSASYRSKKQIADYESAKGILMRYKKKSIV